MTPTRWLPSFLARLSAATLLCALPLGAHAQDDSLQVIQAQGKMRVAIANEIPYGYTDLSGDAKGVGPDVARAVLAKLGVEDIQWMPTAFSSLIPGLQARHFDMVAAEMAVMPLRCKQVLFSEPNSSYGEGLLVPEGNPADIHSYQHFVETDDKIAIMAGADQLDILNALGVPQERMVTIANNADAISTVNTGRAAAYAATGATVAQLAELGQRVEPAQSFKDPVIDGEPVRSWGAFAFHPESQALASAFNQALLEFRGTKEWREILARYGFSEQDMKQAAAKTQATLCAE